MIFAFHSPEISHIHVTKASRDRYTLHSVEDFPSHRHVFFPAGLFVGPAEPSPLTTAMTIAHCTSYTDGRSCGTVLQTLMIGHVATISGTVMLQLFTVHQLLTRSTACTHTASNTAVSECPHKKNETAKLQPRRDAVEGRGGLACRSEVGKSQKVT